MKRCVCMICSAILLCGCSMQEQTTSSTTENQQANLENVNTVEEAIMVDGKLYVSTGEESPVDFRCGNMDGEITSSVAKDSLPTVDNASNFGSGYGYQCRDEYIDVLKDGKWIVFAPQDV